MSLSINSNSENAASHTYYKQLLKQLQDQVLVQQVTFQRMTNNMQVHVISDNVQSSIELKDEHEPTVEKKPALQVLSAKTELKPVESLVPVKNKSLFARLLPRSLFDMKPLL